MRKTFVYLLLVVLLLGGTMTSTVSTAHADDLFSGWTLHYGTDVFGDTDYSTKYVQTSVFCSGMGKFGGVAVIGIHDTKAVIDLFRFDNDLTTMYSITDQYTSYEVNIKDSSGNKYKYECEQTGGVIVVGENSIQLAFTNPNKNQRLAGQLNTFSDILAAGGKIQFVISPQGYSSIKYDFIVDDNSFSSAYPITRVDTWRASDINGVDQIIRRVKAYKYGFIDNTGKTIVPWEWDATYGLSEGRIAVEKNDKWGFINARGELLIPCQWENVDSFAEGLAAVKKNDKWGCIDASGKLVIPYQYDSAFVFSEGLAAVLKSGKYGYIDISGKLVIPYQYDSAFKFSEGLAMVEKNDKWGWIDKTGRFIIPCQWDGTGEFSNGFAHVEKNDKWGIIDKTGKLIIPCEWDYLSGHFSEGLELVEKNGKYGYIDTSNQLIVPCEWDWARSFSEGLAAVRRNGKWGFVDKTGALVIPCKWEDVSYRFSNGLASVKKNDKWGYIDKTGQVVIPCALDSAEAFASDGLAVVEQYGQFYLMDNKGNKSLIHSAPTYVDNTEAPAATPTLKQTIIPTPTATPAPTYTPLKQGDRGEDVMAMKRRLQELGYFSAGAEFSNQYNKTTTERVKLFQKANGLKQTGIADATTLMLLYSDNAKKNPY